MLDALNFMQIADLMKQANEKWWKGLSDGEKQRVALVRPWLHKPRFLVLDEATNAIPHAMEAEYIKRTIRMGISVITIAHHQLLRDLHDYSLDIKDNETCRFYKNE